MKRLLKLLNIAGILAIIALVLLFANNRIKGQEYEYELRDNQFVKFSIQNAIKKNHKKKIVDFGATEVQYLSGKTFKLNGIVIFEGLLNNKIKEEFECIATGITWESNPSDTYRINMYQEN